MSGYLQRLVNTVSRPAATVHPFAGSIFAAAREKEPGGFESEEFVAAAPKAATPIASPISQRGTELDPARNANQNAEYRPLAPVSPVAHAEARAVAGDASRLREEPAAAATRYEFESAEPRSRASQERTFTPLVATDASAAESGIATPPARANRHDFPATRGTAASQRESEDIQIHIGRIEVTAVRPPVARSTKPPDRGPSLDAYLNRRAR